MGLRFDPIGGGKFKQFVQQIIEVESQPIQQLEARKAKEQQKLQLFKDFKGKFTGLQTALDKISTQKNLREFKVDLGDGASLMNVTVDRERAVPGSYQMEIEALANRSSMITNPVEDPDQRNLGIGYVVVNKADGDTWSVFVDESESSLNAIAKKINETKDAPIQAAVIQDAYDQNERYRLLLTSKKDGFYNGVEFPQLYFLDGRSFWVEDDILSENALMKVDGFEVEGNGNDVPDFITGVNIQLKQARPGETFTMKIDLDKQKIAAKVKEVVEKTNEILKFINLQNAVDDKTDTSTKFTGDTSLQSVEYRLRNLMHEGFLAGFNSNEEPKILHMREVGVSFAKDGSLTFSEDKLNQALDKDYDGVSEALAGDFGFGYQMSEVLKGWTRPFDGLLTTREKGLQSRIDQIDRNIDTKSRYLEQRTKTLTEKFSRLQGALGALQQQGQYVQATLGSTGGGNLVQQLLG